MPIRSTKSTSTPINWLIFANPLQKIAAGTALPDYIIENFGDHFPDRFIPPLGCMGSVMWSNCNHKCSYEPRPNCRNNMSRKFYIHFLKNTKFSLQLCYWKTLNHSSKVSANISTDLCILYTKKEHFQVVLLLLPTVSVIFSNSLL